MNLKTQAPRYKDEKSVSVFLSHPNVTLSNGHPWVLEIDTGMNSVHWDYTLNTSKQDTYGGEVIQILSASIGDLTIEGVCRDYTERETIQDWFKQYMYSLRDNNRSAESSPVKIQYPHRGWTWNVYIKEAPNFHLALDVVTPAYEIVCGFYNEEEKSLLSSEIMSRFSSSFNSPQLPTYIMRQYNGIYNDPQPIGHGGIIDTISPAQAANTMGENFQRLVGAWSFGDFARFDYDALGIDKNANQFSATTVSYWQKLFGTDILVQNLGQNDTFQNIPQSSSGSTGTSTELSASQNRFANHFAVITQFQFGFIATWIRAEEPKVDKVVDARHPGGDYNYLNVGQNDSGPTADSRNHKFAESPEAAADATLDWMKNSAAPAIRDFLTSMPGKSVEEELRILQQSPWASSHYPNIIDLWQRTIEPSITLSGGASGVRGDLLRVMDWAVTVRNQITYTMSSSRSSWQRLIPHSGTFTFPRPLSRTISCDCSASVQMVYTLADTGIKLDGQSLDGWTQTEELWLNSKGYGIHINDVRVGDLIFHGGGQVGSATHVNLCHADGVSNGAIEVWNNGGPEGAHSVKVETYGTSGARAYSPIGNR